jgi:nucleoside-diphosphate-sugar epimerase
MGVTLVVHDDSVMSRRLVAAVGSEGKTQAVAAATTDDATLRASCRSVDTVVYVATGWDEVAADRELAQLRLVIAALGGSGKRLLYVSEASVLGDTGVSFGNEDNPRSEKAPHPWRVAAEKQLDQAVAMGVQTVVVRPALVHGDGAGQLVQSLVEHAQQHGESLYVGDGAARTSTVHIDDVTALIRVALLRAPPGSTFAAASTEVLSWHQIAVAVAGSINGPCPLRSITAEEATQLGLDAATMTTTTVIRDHAAWRRLNWRTTGPPLLAAAPSVNR